jgi:DNA repair protein RadB
LSTHAISLGCNALDGLLRGGIERGEITLLYGEAATGKTTAAIQAAVLAAAKGLKVLFIDCDNSFTPQRFYQIGGNDAKSLTEHVMLFFPNTFEEQRTLVESLDNYITPNLGLVIIDSISTLYRIEFQRVDSIFNLNRDLTRQLAYLANLTLTKKTACLITSQVRARIKSSGDQIEPVARRALLHFPGTIIRIQNSPNPRVREFILERLKGTHTEGRCLVEITERGLANISS